MLKYILKIIKEERERIHSIMIEIIPEWIEKLEDEDLVFIKKFVLASGSLKEIAKESGAFIATGSNVAPLDEEALWNVSVKVKV